MPQIECPSCAKRFEYRDENSGRNVPCPKCGQQLTLKVSTIETIAASPSRTGIQQSLAVPNERQPVEAPRVAQQSQAKSPATKNNPSRTNPTNRLRSPLKTSTPSPVSVPGNVISTGSTFDTPPFKQLGRFEVGQLLGSGAFGRVFRGYDPELRRDVALKVPHVAAMQSEEARGRLMREPQAAAQLRHPNIVPVFDAGFDGDQYYIASAFIDGKTLKKAKADHKFTFQQVAEMIRKLADALHYAHEQGIVHRDVKPDNIMLDLKGVPHLTDFGIASWSAAQQELTQDHSVLGTPAYMSPEQAGANVGKVGPASDQYALGVVLYELLCGQRPFGDDLPILILLHEIREKDPLPPRQHNLDVPLDLETICLKAMSKSPGERYGDCQELAEDLRRYLADEPIHARRMGAAERMVRWTRRNPLVAGLAAAVLLIALLGFTAVTWQWRRATDNFNQLSKTQSERAQAQLDALLRAEVSQVPVLLQTLQSYRAEIEPRLIELAGRKNLTDRERLHVSLAMLPADATQVPYLRGRLLTSEASEVLVIRGALTDYPNGLSEHYWPILEDTKISSDIRLRAAVALAAFDPESDRWSAVGQQLAEILVRENSLLITRWQGALRPVRNTLAGPLSVIYSNASRLDSERTIATDLLADYASDRPDVLVELIQTANAPKFGIFFPKLKPFEAQSVPLLQAKLREEISSEATPSRIGKEQERDALAQRQANCAVALLLWDQPLSVWPLLAFSPDPSLRNYLIHRLASCGVDSKMLVQRLTIERDVSTRRALILSIGEYKEDQLDETGQKDLISLLLKWYKNDPDAGIHGAAEWLLRRRGQSERLAEVDKQLAIGHVVDDHGWYLTPTGHAMTVVRGPVEYLQGSPLPVNGIKNEQQNRLRIERSFAIATKEVTIAQFRQFSNETPGINLGSTDQWAPDDNCPRTASLWYDAAEYCNWLSMKEGIPQSEWCYPTGKRLSAGMEPLPNYLSLHGYRLPNEAEWEYACRAGTTTDHYFGTTNQLTTKYAWLAANSKGRTWPVAGLKPNDLGLFDMLGNVSEWCGEREIPVQDTEDKSALNDSEKRVTRGGSAFSFSSQFMSTSRSSVRPNDRSANYGFRIVRTLP